MKNVKAGLILIVSQVISVIFAAGWLIFTLMSFLMLDQVEDLNALQTVSLIIMWCFPLAFIGAGIVSWLLYHKRKFRAAVWIGLIPLLWVLPFFGFYGF